MNTLVKTRFILPAAFLIGGVLAGSAAVNAASPWFHSGGIKPIPMGDRKRDRDRNHERRLGMYRENRFISQLYQGFLKRQPSSSELRFWSERLGRDANPTELVQDFMSSDEFFIRQTYLGLLGREVDPSGMETYTRALQGGQSRADVVESILGSEEFIKRMR